MPETLVTPAATTGRAARRAMLSAWIGWMFDGYENYAFVLVMPVAMRQLVPPDQIERVALYSGAVLAATLLGWEREASSSASSPTTWDANASSCCPSSGIPSFRGSRFLRRPTKY